MNFIILSLLKQEAEVINLLIILKLQNYLSNVKTWISTLIHFQYL